MANDIIRGFLEQQAGSGGVLSQELERKNQLRKTRLELTLMSRKLEIEHEKMKAEEAYKQDLTRVRPELVNFQKRGVPQGFDLGGKGITPQEREYTEPFALTRGSGGQSMHPIPLSSPEVQEIAKMYGFKDYKEMFTEDEQKRGWVPKARIDSMRYNRPVRGVDMTSGRERTDTGNTKYLTVPGASDLAKDKAEATRFLSSVEELETLLKNTPDKAWGEFAAKKLLNKVTPLFGGQGYPEIRDLETFQEAMGTLIAKGGLNEVGNLNTDERKAGLSLAGRGWLGLSSQEKTHVISLLKKLARHRSGSLEQRQSSDMFGSAKPKTTREANEDVTQEDLDDAEYYRGLSEGN